MRRHTGGGATVYNGDADDEDNEPVDDNPTPVDNVDAA